MFGSQISSVIPRRTSVPAGTLRGGDEVMAAKRPTRSVPPTSASRNNDASKSLTAEERKEIYAARRFIGTGVEKKLEIQIPFDVYFQDPLVAKENPKLAFDEEWYVPWE